MSEETEARIRKLEAIEEIKNLQARYAYLIDSSQMEKVPDLFADDFVVQYDFMGTYRTKAELREFLERAGYPVMCHQMLTPLIEVDGDKATGIWYLFGPFTVTTAQGDVAVWIQGKYENEYVRVDGKWKFSRVMLKFKLISPHEDGWVKTRMMGQ